MRGGLASAVYMSEGKCEVSLPNAQPLLTVDVKGGLVHSLMMDFGGFVDGVDFKSPFPYTDIVTGESDLWIDMKRFKMIAAVLAGHYNSTMRPPAAIGSCSKTAIHQTYGSCYMVSVSLLVSKIEPIYNSLGKSSKDYADVFAVSHRPTVNASSCKMIPRDIKQRYTSLVASYNASFLHGKSDLLGIEQGGGYDQLFLQAILIANGIEYTYHDGSASAKYVLEMMRDITDEKPDVSSDGKLIVWQHLFTPTIAYSKLKSVLERASALSKGRLLGGTIGVDERDEKKYFNMLEPHVVAFTVCNDRTSTDFGKVIVCNVGRCDHTFDEQAINLSTDVLDVVLLIAPYKGWKGDKASDSKKTHGAPETKKEYMEHPKPRRR